MNKPSAALPATEMMVEFSRSTGYRAMPEAVRREGPRAFLNFVGVTLGGMNHPATKIAADMAEEFSGRDKVPVLGRRAGLDALNAAFINTMASCANVFDDTHLATVAHPTGPTAGAILALAGRKKVNGEDFLAALIHGIEATCRLAVAMIAPPAKGNVGWYVTGVTGGVGAALASARILGLDRERTTWAVGLGALQGSGFRRAHTSMAIAFVPADAGRAGLEAALLAERGFTATDRMLEAPHGFASVFATEANLAAVTDGLGTRWETLSNVYKPYPCGIVIHPALDACIELAREVAPKPAEVAKLRIAVHPLCLTLCDRPAPADGQAAQVSLQHWAAASLARGRASLAESGDDAVNDPAVLAIRGRIDAVPDASLARDAARVRLDLANGKSFEKTVEHGIGSKARPMSDAQLDEKFLAQAVPVLGGKPSERLLKLCRDIASLDDVGEIGRAAALPR